MNLRIASLLAALLLPSVVLAEQKQSYGDYEIHYATQLTADLQPEVARAYGIPRSGKRAYVMLHARRLAEDGSSSSAAISIMGNVRNLVGQVRALEWQQVEEDGAIYSISHFPVTNRERAIFTLEITPAGSTRKLPLSFEQQFYTE